MHGPAAERWDRLFHQRDAKIVIKTLRNLYKTLRPGRYIFDGNREIPVGCVRRSERDRAIFFPRRRNIRPARFVYTSAAGLLSGSTSKRKTPRWQPRGV